MNYVCLMLKRTLEYTDIDAYKNSIEISSVVWHMVLKWTHFQKDTIGKQLIRAVDSVGANIAEGYGRYHKKDKIRFFYYSMGSCFEAKHWLELAHDRQLINDASYIHLQESLLNLPKEINQLISYIRTKLKK